MNMGIDRDSEEKVRARIAHAICTKMGDKLPGNAEKPFFWITKRKGTRTTPTRFGGGQGVQARLELWR